VTTEAQPFDVLLTPRSVAIVGASNEPTRISGRAQRYLRESGYGGAVYPVNPNRGVVQGLAAFPSLRDLPEVPDVALVGVPAERAVQALEEAAEIGVKGAIVFASGFAEHGDGGILRQRRVAELVASTGMRVVGPNCLGVFNAHDRFFGTFAIALDGGLPGPGPVAITSQSGAYGSHLLTLAQRRGLGVGYLVTTGNEVDVDVAEAIGSLAVRDDVAVILGYAEGIRDGQRFLESVAEAHQRQVPIVFMKAGRSEVGAQAVSSHTASLAGSDEVFDAVCEEYGVVRVTTTEEQLDVAYGCLRGIFPRGRRLGVVSLSGGMGVQICDAAERSGLDVPPLPNDVQAGLLERFPYASFANPVDLTAQVVQDWDLLDAALEAVLGCDQFDAAVVSLTTVPLGRQAAPHLQKALGAAAERHPDRLVALTCLAEPEVLRAFDEAGFLVFEELDRAVATLATLVRAGEGLARDLPERSAADGTQVSVSRGTEDEAKHLLAEAGVAVLPERIVSSESEAVAAADGLGYPVVLKVVSPDVTHKTDAGGVALGLDDAGAVRNAYAAVQEAVRAAVPLARIDGVLVAPMAPDGVDVLIGSHCDATFGPVIAFGLGGVFVELLDDVALALAPVDADRAQRMIRSIRGFCVLDGIRGGPAYDLDAVARAIVAVSRLAAANVTSIRSIDVNPVRVSASGAVALDASVVPA
jgi:acyl-CoA synthetase (NDP forming)